MTQIRKEFWEEKEAKENSMAKFYASKNQQYHGKLSSDHRFGLLMMLASSIHLFFNFHGNFIK